MSETKYVDSSVFIAKSDITKSQLPTKESKQPKDSKTIVWVRTPEIPFSAYNNVYNGSFMLRWILEKINSSANSWFNTEDEEILKVLDTIDMNFVIQSLTLYWNCFMEVIRAKNGKVVKLLPILANTMLILWNAGGYKQKVDAENAYFNVFTPMEDRPDRIQIWEATNVWTDELSEWEEDCGYNPNLNEVYHFKSTSLTDKYYWNSTFSSAIDQLVLLKSIDTCYQSITEKGFMKTTILYNKSNEKKMSEQQNESLSEFMQNRLKWVEKAGSALYIEQDLWVLTLDDMPNSDTLLKYRDDLMKSIAISCNVPYDILSNKNSNKATAQTALESFNLYTILPLQKTIIKDIKRLFIDNWISQEELDNLAFNTIDTKDDLEVAKVNKMYVDMWAVKLSEVREKLNLPPIDGIDDDPMTDNDIDNILNNVEKTYEKQDSDSKKAKKQDKKTTKKPL